MNYAEIHLMRPTEGDCSAYGDIALQLSDP